jgi:hypothetical protein
VRETPRVDARSLWQRALGEARELGSEPPNAAPDLWREEHWGAVVLLAGLANDDVALIRRAASRRSWRLGRRATRARALLLDAAVLAEIGHLS